MRNLKKFLALVLATLMVISAAATVSAYSDVADDSVYATAINTLSEYGIVKGIGNDEFGADLSVQRYQMALMMVRALEPESDWNVGGMKVFEDTPEEIYGNYFGAIAYARMSGIINGVDDTHFAPADGIKYCDALIMAVRALGYTVDVTVSPYWMGAYQTAAKLGLTKNVGVIEPTQVLTRAQTAQLIYNMIKATPADGGATIEEKNFNAKGENNTTKAVITATANQSFTGASEKVVNAEYVTLQLLNADGTLGDGFYAKFADLGFDEDVKADDVIGYSVDLVNYKNGTFVKSVPNKAKVVLTSDVTLNDSKNKLTVDGKTYWLVTEYTGSPLKNEIIVKTDDGKTATSRLDNVNKLLYKGTSVVAPDGTELAIKSGLTTANGETLYYLASQATEDAYLLYTVSELLAVPEIAKAYDKYVTTEGYVDVKTIEGNRMITLFDDNDDETYDRAIITPVYMTVFNTKDGKKININGAEGTFSKSTEGVTVSDDTLSKGDIFVYTYNKQTKTINVLETLDLKYGTIDAIDLIADSASKYTITISGTKYKFGGLNSTVTGADLVQTNAGELNKPDSIDKIVSKPALDYVNYANFISTASIGATVKYYVYNGYVIYAEAYDVEESFNLIAIKNMVDVDSEGLLADIYVDGKLVEDAIISEVLSGDKTVKLSSLSQFAFSKLAYEYMDKAEDNIYKGIKLEDGTYRLGVAMYDENGINKDITTPVKEKGFGMTKVTGLDDAIEFVNGISDGTKYNRLITNDNTVFYLIGMDGKLDVIQTSGKDYAINLSQVATVYADKVGFSGDAKGTATRIVVVGYDTVEGFGIKSTTNAVVYIPVKVNVGVGSYQINTAKNFGLDGEDGAFYYYKNIAVDLADGATVSLYSSKKLAAGEYYEVDSNGVVLYPETPRFTTNTVIVENTKDNIVTDDQYIEVIDIDGNKIVDLEDRVSAIKFINANGSKAESKGNVKDALTTEPAYIQITYLADKKTGDAIDLGDGKFVMVIAPTTVKTLKTIEITINATDVPNEFSVTVTARVDGKVDAKATYEKPGTYEFAFDSKSNDVTASEGFILEWDDRETFSKAHIEVVPEE